MTTLPINIDLIEIPAGCFWMGSSQSDPNSSPNETPRSNRSLPTFYISRYPITNLNYKTFVNEAGHAEPSHWNSVTILETKGNHPVVNVSFDDAQAFCNWLSQKSDQSFRLPTEEEWEKAARGDKDMRQYPWGDEWANYRCNSKEGGRLGTSAVTEHEKSQENVYGLADLVGNVWEWTTSEYKAYPDSNYTSSKYGKGYRVVRGGSFQNDESVCRVSQRGSYPVGTVRNYLGFRVVAEHAFPINPSDKNQPQGQDAGLELPAVDKKRLRENIVKAFSRNELRRAVSDLGVNSDEFSQKISEFAFELIDYCERRGMLKELVEVLEAERPNIDW